MKTMTVLMSLCLSVPAIGTVLQIETGDEPPVPVTAESSTLQARNEYTAARKRLAEFKTMLRQKSGRYDVSPENISDAISRLDDQLLELEVDNAAKSERMKVLSEQVATQSAEAERRISSDDVLVELSNLVKLKMESLYQVRKLNASGSVSGTEVNDAMEAVAEAKARLLERKYEIAEQAGGGSLAEFNHELLSLTADLRESSVRLAMVSEQLKKLGAIADEVDELFELQDAVSRARDAMVESQQNLRRSRVYESIRDTEENRRQAGTQPSEK